MSVERVTYTHEGWFWLCPILYADEGAEGCVVDERWPWTGWLFTVSEWLEEARIFWATLLIPDYEPSFMFKVRQLDRPIVREIERD
jgi:hypothetical protein